MSLRRCGEYLPGVARARTSRPSAEIRRSRRVKPS